MPAYRPLTERFWEKVTKDGPELVVGLGACWLWTAGRGRRGYGIVKVGLKTERAHRVAFFLEHGRWPTPNCLHHCDGGGIGCVRPSHLYEGTQVQNIADMDARGRRVTLRGATHPCAKLDEQKARAIRARMKVARITNGALAREYGVSESLISHIRTGRSWPEAT